MSGAGPARSGCGRRGAAGARGARGQQREHAERRPPPARARRRARLAYALYLGLGALRRAVPEPGTTAPDLAAELDVVIDALLPAESVARGS